MRLHNNLFVDQIHVVDIQHTIGMYSFKLLLLGSKSLYQENDYVMRITI